MRSSAVAAVTYVDLPPVEVEIAQLEMDSLAFAHTGVVKDAQQCLVTQVKAGLEQIGGFSVKSAKLAEQNLLVQSGFHLVLEDGVLRPGFALLESGYDIDVHIRLFIEIKAVAQSELLELRFLAVGLLLGC